MTRIHPRIALWNPGLRLRDEGLLQRDTTHRQKVVLAARLSPLQRDESLRQLVDRLPFNRDDIRADTKILAENGIIETALSGKYLWGIRIVSVDPRYDNRAGHYVFLPGPLVDKIVGDSPRGASSALLLAMLYQREQLRRGAIHVYMDAARADLGLSEKEYRNAKNRLVRHHVIEKVSRHDKVDIYVMAGTETPPEPAKLTPELSQRTTTFWSSPPSRCNLVRPLGAASPPSGFPLLDQDRSKTLAVDTSLRSVSTGCFAAEGSVDDGRLLRSAPSLTKDAAVPEEPSVTRDEGEVSLNGRLPTEEGVQTTEADDDRERRDDRIRAALLGTPVPYEGEVPF